MSRATASATITLALVACPVKLYLAAASESIQFNLLSKNKARVKQQLLCSVTGEVVDRKDCLRGYEYSKNQFVVFTNDEIKELEETQSNIIDIMEFVPISSIDLVQVEKSYYLGADKGGDKSYRLLVMIMQEKECVAVSKWMTRGKDQLVIIKPYKDGLILHQMYYANEVRSFEDVPAPIPIRDDEKALALKLIEALEQEKFNPEKYYDAYYQRVVKAVEAKAVGQVLNILPARPAATVIDLLESLKGSLEKAKPKEKIIPKQKRQSKRRVS